MSIELTSAANVQQRSDPIPDPVIRQQPQHAFYSHAKLVDGMPIPLKNISLLASLFPIYGKIKNVPNHQAVKSIHTYHCLPTRLIDYVDQCPIFFQTAPAPQSQLEFLHDPQMEVR